MTKRYQIKGINSDSDTCENCGKTNLKKVVWLDILDGEGNETGDVVAFGCDCAATALMGNKSAANKRAVEYNANNVQLAKGYLAKGFTPRQVCDWLGGRGYRVGLKEDRIMLDFTVIKF